MTPPLLLLLGLLATIATAAPTLTSCLNSASVPILLIGTEAFKEQTSPYNLRLTPTAPHVVALPSTLAQTESALKCAYKTDTKVSVKSGGHSYGAYGLSGTLVVDLQELQTVSYSPSSKLVTVGGGVRLGNLATKLYAAAQRGMPHGTCPGVGIGGHATLGGFGLDSRLWGLATDMISSATVVLANGTAVTASATKNKDIYYALRGAGPGFAVVTEFKMKTFPAPTQNTHFTYTWTIGSAATAAKAFKVAQDWGLKSAPKELGYGILMFPGNQFVVRGVYYGSESAFNTVIASFLTKINSATGGITPSTNVQVLDWITSLTTLAGSSLTTPVTGYNSHDTFVRLPPPTPSQITKSNRETRSTQTQ
jgi:FAD/FMN-containing dehydrogenase